MGGRRRFVLLAGMLLAAAVARGEVAVPWQEDGVWPESPQSRAIRQALMPQPALMTGACEFDVPLYTLSVGGVSLPLSLHYRSNGIRVDDDPQPVGYGWVLSPALRVTRQIMGRPDELFRPRGTDNIDDYETNFRSVVMDARATNAASRDSLGRYDAEHDIYTVYLLDATLTLVRDWESGAFHGAGCGEYSVTADRALQAIRVTDPLGRVYDFSTPGEYTDERINRTEWLLTSLTLGGTLTSTARWKPLVGVTSLASPNGTISAYTYDDEGRLAEEKVNGRIRSRYAYRVSQDGDNRVTSYRHTSQTACHSVVGRADGLGRVFATFTELPRGYTASAVDYDAMGRVWRQYAPAPVGGTASGVSEIAAASAAFHGDGHPYAETSYEPSPSAIATATAKAGDAWHDAGKAASRRILANDGGTYRCPRYVIDGDGVRLDGNYAPGQLEVTEDIDEDGVTVRTYKDFMGRTIRRTTGTGGSAAATDYVYDGYGDLRYILPPGLDGTHSRSDDVMKKLAYWYDYDGRGRLVAKKLPGAAVAEYRYDPAGRIVAERDGRLEEDTWHLFVYDGCGRQVAKLRCSMTDGELEDFASVCRTASLTAAVDEYDRGGYALSPVPAAWPGDVVWAKYYDDYRFVAVRGLGTDFAFEATDAAASYSSATGLLTGMYTGSGYEAYYYDGEGREIQRYATGFNSGRRCTAYNYDGTVSKRTYTYTEAYLPDMEEEYSYDSCGRLTSTTIRVDNAVPAPDLELAAGHDAEAADASSPSTSARWATAVVRREYDAIGRLARLRHGDAATTEYAYDVHSWPVSQYTTYGTGANTSSIGYTLEHAPCYNGNISRRTWAEGGYAYTYDALNRLESAVFTPAEGLADRPAIERYLVPDFSVYYGYDLRGNTTNVVRYGVVDAVSDFDRVETFGTLDELSCAYDGNRLSNITAITEALPFDGVTGLHADGEFELSYNAAGDMVSDASRGLLYTRWNADGHPVQYDLEGGHRQRLGWDAFGNHLYTSYETSVAPVSAGTLPGRTRRTSLRAYSGDGHILRGGAGNSAADTLEMLRFPGGYFDGKLVPHYYVTDYLGSNIAVIRADGALVQSATYYPYGEPHRDPAASANIGISVAGQSTSATSIANPYLYGGKEYVRRDGLREYIYGARMYVPSVTRFNRMDNLCEKHPDQSPYLFCGGNPVRYGDDSGNDYHVKVNHEEQTITISADYYAYKSDAESVTAAIGFWNDLSGQYTMDGYTVNFALTYHEVEPYKAPDGEELEQRKSITYAMKDDKAGNLYMTVPNIPNDKENTVSAGSYSNRLIKISEADKVELTGPHEVGHSLGLLHSAIAGLMYPYGNSPERTKDVSISEIKAMIENAITGVVPKDENGTEMGKGHLDNEEEIKKIEWKYEVTKAQ